MTDHKTRREIDKVVEAILNGAGLTEPPVKVGDLLEHLEVHRDSYNLKGPNPLQRFSHRMRVGNWNQSLNCNIASLTPSPSSSPSSGEGEAPGRPETEEKTPTPVFSCTFDPFSLIPKRQTLKIKGEHKGET